MAKPRAYLLHDPQRDDVSLQKLEALLQRLAEFEAIAPNARLEAVEKILGEADSRVTLFVDVAWIAANRVSFEERWRRWNLVLVQGDGPEPKEAAAWIARCSLLRLAHLPNGDLPRVAQLALVPERYPGVSVLADRKAEIFFEKLLGLGEVGKKVDRVVLLLERQYPALSGQLFNFRQLSMALLHQSFLAASAAGKKGKPVVDFQVSANPDRIVLSARFAAPDGQLAKWRQAANDRGNLLWRTLVLGTDLLSFTAISRRREIEIKALLCRESEFLSDKPKSMLSAEIDTFASEAITAEAARAAKLLPLDALSAELPADTTANLEAETEITTKKEETLLHLKLRTEVLEKEKLNLQNLVKKKTVLVTGLNKDVSRAQRDLVEAQNTHNQEMQRLRLSEEKARNEAKELAEKLKRLERQGGAFKASASEEAEEEKRDYEKDWKQADYARRLAEEKLVELSGKIEHQEEIIKELRDRSGQLTKDLNELKSIQIKLETKITTKENELKRVREQLEAAQGQKPDESASDKLRETQRHLAEAQTKEQAADKEVKRLNLKLESVEKNVKAALLTHKRQLENAEKQAEEAKKQKSDALKRLQESEAGVKKRLEETNETERKLKRKIEELTLQLAELKKGGKAA